MFMLKQVLAGNYGSCCLRKVLIHKAAAFRWLDRSWRRPILAGAGCVSKLFCRGSETLLSDTHEYPKIKLGMM
jgi:hypothetical protein